MAYIGTQPKDVRSFGKAKFDFTATSGQTAFTGADDDGKTLGFTNGQIQVYVNGILMDDSDYTTSSNNTITLASPANANDIISVVVLQTDIPNSDYVPATGGTFSGDIGISGAAGSDAVIRKNGSSGRDELQIYAGGDAYTTGSKGAGIHLYGNSDSEHSGNFAVLTGPNDQGNARIIASGREDKTHVTIGNSMWDYVDNGDDHALLNLKGPTDQPALLIEGASGSEGDIVVPSNEVMQMGHWDKATSTFTEAMSIEIGGQVRKYKQPRGWMAKTSADTDTVSTSNTTKKITFGSYTAVNGMSFSNSNDRLTIPSTGAGEYFISVLVAGSVTTANAGDGIYVSVQKNGSNIWGSYARPIATTGSTAGMEFTMQDAYVVPLAGSDYLEVLMHGISTATAFTVTRARLVVYAVG